MESGTRTLISPRRPIDDDNPRGARLASAETVVDINEARERRKAQAAEKRPFEVLVVENDLELAFVLKDMIEMDGRCRVTDIACDLAETLAAIEAHRPDLALIDIHLSGNATGIEVAAKANQAGIQTLFSTGSPLPFPVPELALGCLCKPYTSYSVGQSILIAEALVRGEPVEVEAPLELQLY